LKNKPEVSNYASLSKEVTTTKNRLTLLKTALPQRKNISATIKEIVDRKPKGVSIEVINWQLKDGDIQVLVNGHSQTRDLLLGFASALQENKYFTSVYVPVSSYTNRENTGFSITLTIKGNS
jgi:hypothetical protein